MGDTESFLNLMPQEMPCDPRCPACQDGHCGPADRHGPGWLQLLGKWPGVGPFPLARGRQPICNLGQQEQQLEFRAYCLSSSFPQFSLQLHAALGVSISVSLLPCLCGCVYNCSQISWPPGRTSEPVACVQIPPTSLSIFEIHFASVLSSENRVNC